MSLTRLWIGLLAVSAFAAEPKLDDLLQKVEARYNRTKSLQVVFQEQYTRAGEPRRTESGVLMLHKPGRMRWDYTQPKGKLFVCDGKFLYLYTPDDNRAERMKLQMSDDMRAPLAFLLGRLNFKEDFKSFSATPDRENVFITATPKSDKMPYTEVTFLVSPDSVIHYLKVRGQDGSLLEYTFEDERKNPPVADTTFRFAPPPGVEFVDSSR